MELTRRRLLQSTSTLALVALAGCSAVSDRTPTPTQTPSYDHLRTTSVYRGDDIGVRIPDRVPTVKAPTNADLIIIHGNPAVDGERAVNWLADDRVVALLGDSAQSTWTEWTRSDAYRDAFHSGGESEAAPAPHLLVAAAAGTTATTFRFSWDGLPSNAQLLAALDETMGDVESLTPNQ